ncbi:MAG: hypothetical protein JWQ20_4443 [Conexibacter sp.]|nr:hypothetical protein [Conexibacter sp.]
MIKQGWLTRRAVLIGGEAQDAASLSTVPATTAPAAVGTA